MKVVIVGGGLGGLACAIACRREGIDVEILERSPEVHEVGAGIQIPPNGGRIMRDFGLLPQLLEKGSPVQQVDFRRYKDGRLLRSMPFGDDITEEFGVPWMYVTGLTLMFTDTLNRFAELFIGWITIASFLMKQSDLVRFFNSGQK